MCRRGVRRKIAPVLTKRWNRLSPCQRRAILVGGAFDAGLKVASLIDLAQQPHERVRGSKRAWATGLTLVNSVGILPVAYLLYGRRRG